MAESNPITSSLAAGSSAFVAVWLPCLSFFCKSHRALLCLHTFPTRRSSDLPTSRNVCPVEEQQGERASDHDLLRRSEEHTSELQSQSKLVCRLLLEKRKQGFDLCGL